MQCHEVGFEIFGDDMQIVEVELDPGEVVIAEAGAMNYMEDGITFDTTMGDGKAFMHIGGTVIKRELNNETIRVDTGCIRAVTPGIDYDIERSGSLKSMVFGGEGLFLATLRGTGTVHLQSLPFSRLAGRVIRATGLGTSSKGEGAVLGGLGDLFGDR